MEQVVHAVLAGKEVLGVVAGAARIFHTGVAQGLHVTPRAKRFLTRAINHHGNNCVVLCPSFEAVGDDVDHFPRQRVKGLFDVKSQLPNAVLAGSVLGDQNTIGHRFFHSGSRFSRKALVPSCWSSVENSATNSSRSATKPSEIAILRAEWISRLHAATEEGD